MTIAGLATPLSPTARAEETSGSVRGTVALAGYPLPTARLVLHLDDGKAISGRVWDGVFTFDNVPAGTLRVSVMGEGLPMRYADPDTSGLSVRVEGGSNRAHLELDADGIEVGRPAPPLPAHGPDGNFIEPADLRGKYVLLAFWSAGTKGPVAERQFARLREVRREFAGQERLLIVSLCADANMEEGAAAAWNEFVIGQGVVDYGDGKRRFIDDSRWWQCMDIAGPALPSAPRYGVGRMPEAFLIGPDGRFVAVRIPPEALRREVAKALGRAP
jgi:hypothetical protein